MCLNDGEILNQTAGVVHLMMPALTALGRYEFIMPPPLIGGGIKRCFCLTSGCRTYIGRNSRTESPRKTKIGTEVAHVTRYSDTTFKVKGHQAALVGCTGRPTWTYSNGDLSVCVHDVYSVTYHLHPWAGHIVAAAGLQLVTMFIRHIRQSSMLLCDTDTLLSAP